MIATNGSGGAYYVAQGLRVLDVAPPSTTSGVLGGGSGSYFVVVAVNKQTALRIAAALEAQGGARGQRYRDYSFHWRTGHVSHAVRVTPAAEPLEVGARAGFPEGVVMADLVVGLGATKAPGAPRFARTSGTTPKG